MSKVTYKRTEESREKSRISHIGQKAWNKGKSPSEFTRKKMSESAKVKFFSEEHRENMSKASKGKKKSQNHIKNMVLNHSHSKPWLGKNHKEETKIKMSISQKGERGNNWKGGITPKNVEIRNSYEYKKWREEVFIKDNYTCQKYGIRGGNLVAHHILNFSDSTESRFDVKNGITLSDKAHKEFHKKYGIKNNTQEQLKEFLNLGSTMII